jgi:hypothetical protein
VAGIDKGEKLSSRQDGLTNRKKEVVGRFESVRTLRTFDTEEERRSACYKLEMKKQTGKESWNA